MATKAITTKGVQLQIDNSGGTGVFTTIAEVLNISGPGEQVATIDATSFDSLAKEWISSALPDVSETTFELHYIGNNVQHQQLRTDLRSGVRRNFKLLIPDGTSVAFAALITNVAPEFPLEGKISQNITLKPTGLPTWTYPI